MLIHEALENLIKATSEWANEPGLEEALADAKNALGYDPLNPERRYSVSLVIDVDATDPDAAVRFAQELIRDSVEWVYLVTDEDGKITTVDTWNW